MTKETVEQSIKFIKSMKSKRLNITWYGGEPTLCIDIIEEFTKKLRESFGSDNLNSTIVSNGYLLDRSLAIRLKECGVSAVQITIDGPKHIHDMRRKLKSGEGTFEKILKNIEEIFSILQVTIRVNVDKTNLKNAMDLLSYLNEKGILNKANFYLAPINETDQVRNANCINPMEFAQLERQLYKSYSPNKYREIPRATFGLCGAVSPNSFIISSNGKLYKCWDEIGRENSEIGSVYDGITNPDVYFSWMTYNIEKYNPECSECKFMPLCYGGCPHQNRCKTSQGNCLTFKHNCNEVLKDLYRDFKGNNINAY